MILPGLRHLLSTIRAVSSNARRFLLGTFLMGIGHGAVWVHMNLYFRSAGISEGTIGQILSANSVGVVLASLPAALWVDRFRAEAVFRLAAAGFSATLIAALLFPMPLPLMAFSLFSGMFFTVHWVAAAPFFMRNAAQEHRTELFGLYSAIETLATVMSAFGVGALARVLSRYLDSELLGLRWALVAAAIASAVAIVPFSRIRSRPLAPVRRKLRDYLVSRDMKLVLKLSVPAFVIGCGAGLTIPFLNLYFRDRFAQGPAQIGFYFSISQVITMFGFVAGPMLARRFTHVRAVIATELLSIPFFLLLAVADRLWIAVFAFWMRGALMNMNQPVSSAFAMEIVDEDQQAVTNSTRTFAWNLAWMVTTPLGGWFIQHHGYEANMFATMALYLIAALLFWSFFSGRVVGLRPSLTSAEDRLDV